jgi:hypothetical protein
MNAESNPAQPPQQEPIINALEERERVRGRTRMYPEGTDASSVTEAGAKQVIHEVELYRNRKGFKISLKQIGRDVGYSPPVISEVLSMSYNGDWKGIVLDLDRWLEARRKRDEAPQTAQYVLTEVAREIHTVGNLAMHGHMIALVFSPESSGIGKTMALEALHEETPGSLFVTCDKIEANTTGLLRAIARELRIENASNARIYGRIKDRLRGTSRLLIVDQIHNLRKAKDDKPLYVLTDLWDATHAPQLWCGTADLVAYLTRGQARGDESLAQIRSRIGYVRDLMQRCRENQDGGRGEPLVTIQQIREMFGKNKIRLAQGAVRFLYDLANIPDSGALRLCVNLVWVATVAAEQRKMTEIDVLLLQAALKDSVQAETFSRLIAQVHTDPAALRKTG